MATTKAVVTQQHLTDIAEAIRTKGGSSSPLLPSQMAAAIEAIPTGGGDISVAPKEVNFYRPDGVCVYAYTLAELREMTALPEGPKWEGHVFQNWNYTLEDLKEMNCEADVGGIYITDDGCTRITIEIAEDFDRTINFWIGQTVDRGCEICWGDSDTFEPLVGTAVAAHEHTYPAKGLYTIQLRVNSGTLNMTMPSGYNCIGNTSPYGSPGRSDNQSIWQTFLVSASFGSGITELGVRFFDSAYLMKYISIPEGVTVLRGSFANFIGCHFLGLPRSMTSIEGYAASNGDLRILSMGRGVLSVGQFAVNSNRAFTRLTMSSVLGNSISGYFMSNCFRLRRFTALKGFTNIGNYFFYGTRNLAELDLTRPKNADGSPHLVTLLNTSVFNGVPDTLRVIVPDSLYDDYLADTNWNAILETRFQLIKESER